MKEQPGERPGEWKDTARIDDHSFGEAPEPEKVSTQDKHGFR